MTQNRFRDLDEFLVVEPIRLPIRGKEYEFPGEVSGWAGLVLQRMVTGALGAVADGGDTDAAMSSAVSALDTELLDDDQERDLAAEILGDTQGEMIRDGIGSAHIRHVYMTLVVWHAVGEDAALAVWEGKAPEAPNRAARRATTGRSGGAASTTRKRASGSGTSRRSTSPAKPKRKPRAAGG